MANALISGLVEVVAPLFTGKARRGGGIGARHQLDALGAPDTCVRGVLAAFASFKLLFGSDLSVF